MYSSHPFYAPPSGIPYLATMSLTSYEKMSGAGNTFIMFDGRDLPDGIDFGRLAPTICDAAQDHEGADGLIAIYPWVDGDFEMRYYNRDGSTGMMCGNGGRCAVRFAADHGYVSDPDSISFINAGVPYSAALTERGVRVEFPDPKRFKLKFKLNILGAMRTCHYADVGTPHAVMIIDEVGVSDLLHVSQLDLEVWGKTLRHHPDFAPEGANANFVEVLPEDSGIRLRTYERGVEAETGACGTGAISSAIITSALRGIQPPVTVITTSGATLWVDFRIEDGHVTHVSLEGDAGVVGTGEMEIGEI